MPKPPNYYKLAFIVVFFTGLLLMTSRGCDWDPFIQGMWFGGAITFPLFSVAIAVYDYRLRKMMRMGDKGANA